MTQAPKKKSKIQPKTPPKKGDILNCTSSSTLKNILKKYNVSLASNFNRKLLINDLKVILLYWFDYKIPIQFIDTLISMLSRYETLRSKDSIYHLVSFNLNNKTKGIFMDKFKSKILPTLLEHGEQYNRYMKLLFYYGFTRYPNRLLLQ